jgi:hypothetical protein
MPDRLSCLVVTSALALAANAAAAQSPSPAAQPPQARPAPANPGKPAASTTVAPVTVQGQAPPKVIEKQSYAFVQNYAAPGNPELDQIVRWRDPVCVKVTGLIPRQQEAIETRIAEVAKAVDLHVGKPDCKGNIQIVFTDQPQAVMDTLYKRREWILGYYHRHDGVRLKKVSRPIQAWRVTATLGVTGAGDGVGGEVIDDPENMAPNGCGNSHVFTVCLQGVIKNVFVVVDSQALGENGLGVVMDYLVMLALAEPKSLDGCGDLPSVIDLFAKDACPGRDAPDGLTPADASYLTALYSADPEQKAWVERRDIADRMAKILIKASAGG